MITGCPPSYPRAHPCRAPEGHRRASRRPGHGPARGGQHPGPAVLPPAPATLLGSQDVLWVAAVVARLIYPGSQLMPGPGPRAACEESSAGRRASPRASTDNGGTPLQHVPYRSTGNTGTLDSSGRLSRSHYILSNSTWPNRYYKSISKRYATST